MGKTGTAAGSALDTIIPAVAYGLGGFLILIGGYNIYKHYRRDGRQEGGGNDVGRQEGCDEVRSGQVGRQGGTGEGGGEEVDGQGHDEEGRDEEGHDQGGTGQGGGQEVDGEGDHEEGGAREEVDRHEVHGEAHGPQGLSDAGSARAAP